MEQTSQAVIDALVALVTDTIADTQLTAGGNTSLDDTVDVILDGYPHDVRERVLQAVA